MRILLNENVPDYSKWRNLCLRAKSILDDFDKQPGNMAVEKISSLLPPNANVSVDVGMNQCWCAQSLLLKGCGGRIHISGGYGTMGCGLPFAIGSCISLNKDVVFCITGDGGLQMNIQELETIKPSENIKKNAQNKKNQSNLFLNSVNLLFHSEDKEMKVKANKFLVDFESKAESWDVAFQVLQKNDLSEEAYFNALNILKRKIRYDLREETFKKVLFCMKMIGIILSNLSLEL